MPNFIRRIYGYGILWIFLFCQHKSLAQPLQINKALLSDYWPSSWIACPDVAQRDYGVYHFRKVFDLNDKPEKFIIHVSADNRYRLFVNGEPVCSGPARGDLYNWYFETIDISRYLNKGTNVIAALVWNMGEFAAVGQISNQTGFVLQGNTEQEQIVNTNDSWKVFRNAAYSPCSTDNAERLKAYMAVGPGDSVDGSLYPWGWEQTRYNDEGWLPARKIVNSPATVGYGTDNLWTLCPRNIPLMREKLVRVPLIRRVSHVTMPASFLTGNAALEIKAGQTASVLLDMGVNTVAYPQIVTSRGKGSVIKLTYAESLFDKTGNKGNRNDIDGKEIKGNYDIFKPDGGSRRMFRPLWFKTFRYLQLDIQTGDEPLVIDDLYAMQTGYPFELKASFSSNDSSLNKIWEVGWRTAQACAGETFFDTPYYEQLQYEGDTRIQALISLYMTGDDRLMRKAMLDFYHSKTPEGLPQGRYPSNRLQVIPPFSLFWVSMVYDYWMHRNDPVFVKQFLASIRLVMDWYKDRIDASRQMLGPMKWWNFVDWDAFDAWGVPEGAADGNSSIITLQYAYTLRQAAALFDFFEDHSTAKSYNDLADQLNKGTYRESFDAGKGLMADSPKKEHYSQHASIMAILSGAVTGPQARDVFENLMRDSTLSQVTFFYRFYLTRAMKKVGLADRYYSQLTPWRRMLALGLTTFAEKPEPTRSDSHAWSSSPNYDFLATICGIVPASPGFETVLVEPALGGLNEVHGVMPCPKGQIEVFLRKKDAHGLEGTVLLPGNMTGKFKFGNSEITLEAGENEIRI